MRVWIKRVGVICLIPIGLVLLLSILLYIPSVQRFAVRQATDYAGEAIGMQIGIEQIRLSFPLDLEVKGVEVVDAPDTLLSLRSLTISIRALPLLSQQVLIEAIDLREARLNTGSMIEGMAVRGNLGRLYVHADRIDLATEEATLNTVEVSDADITLVEDSTSEEGSASSPMNWRVNLNEINLRQVAFALRMPADSLWLTTVFPEAEVVDGVVDLGAERYEVGSLQIKSATVAYDGDEAEPAPGLDPAHIYLTDWNVSLDSIVYQGKEINLHIGTFSLAERSGLEVSSLTGRVRGDDKQIHIPEIRLQTPHSEATLTATIPWTAIEEAACGDLDASLEVAVGKEDIWIAAGSDWPDDFKRAYPEQPLRFVAGVNGNMSAMRITRCDLSLPGALRVDVTGRMEMPLDSARRSGELRLDARTEDLGFMLAMLPADQRDQYAIPADIRLTGEAILANQQYCAELLLTEDKGRMDLTASFDPERFAYEADLRVDSVEPTHFLPKDSLYWLAADLRAKGIGSDPFAAETRAVLAGRISDIRYGTTSVSDITLDGSLENHALKVDLRSAYPLAKMDLNLEATLRENDIKARLVTDVEHLDLYGMHLMTDTIATTFHLFADVETDLEVAHRADVTLGNWEVITNQKTLAPKPLTLHALTGDDTIQASLHAGDLGIVLRSEEGLPQVMDKLTRLSEDAALQLERDSSVNLALLRPLLPTLSLKITAGEDNPVQRYLHDYYYMDFQSFTMNASTSPGSGLRMDAALLNLMQDTLRVDTIRAEIYQDTLGLIYNVRVVKEKFLQQPAFTAGLGGQLRYNYADAELLFLNGEGEKGLSLGVRAEKIVDGFRFQLFPDDPIIAFQPFHLNADNYVVFRSLSDIEAALHLKGEANASLWIHSDPNGEKPEAVRVELSQIDLGVLPDLISDLPTVEGILNANVEYVPSDSSFMMVADMSVDELYYEKKRVGKLLLNAAYLPSGREDHQVDVHFFRDREEITKLTALYQSGEEEDQIAGTIDFLRFPLNMANPFIPDDMASMAGDLDGSLAFSGTTDQLLVEGHLRLDTASVYVGSLGASFRFDDKRVELKDSRLLFDQYGIYAYNENPFLIDGSVDFRDLSRMTADLKLTANNLQLLNAKRNEESLVYGKLFANLDATAKGPVDALTMRGDLQLLGGTNITYVMQDSPLTVQDRMSGMVTFVNFADTVRSRMPRKPVLPMGGVDMLLTIRIDPAVQANVDLSPDQSSHVNLEGGGDLSFQYTRQGDMVLNGRYTLTDGTIKYSIPVIPLKEFTIKEGSYVLWSGDPMNPTLSLTATERVRTSVTMSGQSSPRSVNFDVGIVLTQQLENLGLQFTLEAPEDLTMQEDLSSKGVEERAKLAVSMLVTGLYLGSNSDGKVNVNMGDALNTFLQSEINNIAGSALKTVDISFGMETYDDEGDSRTDYSFRFAKRFYNDRIRIVLGGRISTGDNINNGQAQPFIDNVSVEYRLDASGSRYVKLFHDKNYESLLEGEITETGGGVVLRKKMLHLRELFNFKKKKTKPIVEEETK